MLAYAEKTFGLAPLGINDARAYPFTNAFSYFPGAAEAGAHGDQAHPRGDRIVWSQASQDT